MPAPPDAPHLQGAGASAPGAEPCRRQPRGRAMRVLVAIDDPDWHLDRLQAAFACHGAETVPARLSECGFGPDPALVGSVPAASVPAVPDPAAPAPPPPVLPTRGGLPAATQPATASTRGAPPAAPPRMVPPVLAACRPDASAASLHLPGFAPHALPDAAYARAIAPGGFEAITRRLGVLHALEACGIAVWNPPRAIERCVDKSTTGFLLARAGIPTPRAWAVEGRAAAVRVVEGHRGRLVAKPLFGAQGRGLRLVDGPDDLPGEQEDGGVFYLQAHVEAPGPGFHDHRLLVVDGALAGAMTRRSASWITNMRRGATAEPFDPDPALREIALRAAAAVGAACAGVDLLRDRHGHPWVLEVNSMPGWRGLQGVTGHDIAERIASALLRRARAAR